MTLVHDVRHREVLETHREALARPAAGVTGNKQTATGYTRYIFLRVADALRSRSGT